MPEFKIEDIYADGRVKVKLTTSRYKWLLKEQKEKRLSAKQLVTLVSDRFGCPRSSAGQMITAFYNRKKKAAKKRRSQKRKYYKKRRAIR